VDYENASLLEHSDMPLETQGLTLSRPIGTRSFFGRSKAYGNYVADTGPEGFLVELPENSRNGAHFHDCPQFQLFFPSDGAWYQRHPFGGLVVHFSDAYTTYGPFGTDTAQLDFYTLRPRHSTMTGFMPWAREQLVEKGGRNVHAPVPAGNPSSVSPGEITTEQVLPIDRDGFGAKLVVAGPGTDITVEPCDARNGGQYVCVVSGAILQEGHKSGERSLAWVAPGEGAFTVQSDAKLGCSLLVMQFPDTDANQTVV
jgi:hypothetical protein